MTVTSTGGCRFCLTQRFKVSVGMVKKLLLQRRRTGEIEARHRFSGRKARLLPERGEELKLLVGEEQDLTLAEMKERLGLECAVGAIHWALGRLGLTYKDASCGRTKPSRCRVKATPLETEPRRARFGAARLHRRIGDQDEHDAPARPVRPEANGWSASPRTDIAGPPR